MILPALSVLGAVLAGNSSPLTAIPSSLDITLSAAAASRRFSCIHNEAVDDAECLGSVINARRNHAIKKVLELAAGQVNSIEILEFFGNSFPA